MADFCDQASETEALHLKMALARSTATEDGIGPVWIDGRPCCRECGEEIPEKRMQAVPGTGRCVGCAE